MPLFNNSLASRSAPRPLSHGDPPLQHPNPAMHPEFVPESPLQFVGLVQSRLLASPETPVSPCNSSAPAPAAMSLASLDPAHRRGGWAMLNPFHALSPRQVARKPLQDLQADGQPARNSYTLLAKLFGHSVGSKRAQGSSIPVVATPQSPSSSPDAPSPPEPRPLPPSPPSSPPRSPRSKTARPTSLLSLSSLMSISSSSSSGSCADDCAESESPAMPPECKALDHALELMRQDNHRSAAEAFLDVAFSNTPRSPPPPPPSDDADDDPDDISSAPSFLVRMPTESTVMARRLRHLACYCYGVCLLYGYGIEQDYIAAVKWLTKAAVNNEVLAIHELGLCFQKGWAIQCFGSIVDRQREKAKLKQIAVAWFKKGAELGYPASQFKLAMCYLQGDGIKYDKYEAARWFRMAGDRGYPLGEHSWAYHKHYVDPSTLMFSNVLNQGSDQFTPFPAFQNHYSGQWLNSLRMGLLTCVQGYRSGIENVSLMLRAWTFVAMAAQEHQRRCADANDRGVDGRCHSTAASPGRRHLVVPAIDWSID
ncbi:uncharacterized protein BJ171DRAFT_514715 [Polychytrium aggregatum]|uniref:uncharacterized protein n=1 Tax=Polychytrium aggregatum TaxID=110093 RepID=UPI0022FDC3AD|nr:uncharacterized protein BJ171DRAFT_514715 [Polychytrium aggregatum]KAI9202323.1 hypothetical protein BJ171DRAFT_514715 [Polychytrium aggregatum]